MTLRVLACAVCLGSAFGDRSYSWPYIGLILMPFVVAGAVLGVVGWYAGWRVSGLTGRLRARLASLAGPAASGDPSPRSHTETT